MEAFPLDWPPGWPRTDYDDQIATLGGGDYQSWDAVVARLRRELERLGAVDVILSTNQPIRRDGNPYSARRLIEDPGVAVYFDLGGRSLVMAQDRYELLQDNIRSLAIAIEGMRQMQRHGGDRMVERAFRGFLALPPPGNFSDFREILEVGGGATLEDCETQYRALARKAGDGHEDLYALNAAIKEARSTLGGPA